jgi:hypothetical protein
VERTEVEPDQDLRKRLLVRLIDAGLVELVLDRLGALSVAITRSALNVLVEKGVKSNWSTLRTFAHHRDPLTDRSVLALLTTPSGADVAFLLDRTLAMLSLRDGLRANRDSVTLEVGYRALQALGEKGHASTEPVFDDELRGKLEILLAALRSDEHRVQRERDGDYDDWVQEELDGIAWQCSAVERLLGRS